MSFPDVTILVVTYNRPEEVRRTIDALFHNIRYPHEHLHWLIADDSTSEEYRRDIALTFYDIDNFEVITTPQRSGWGANVNAALAKAFEKTDYVYFTEDDYLLNRRLHLDMGVQLLAEDETLGLIRYDGIAGHLGLIGRVEERYCPKLSDVVHYWRLMPESTHLNIYSNRPHLKHKRFHEFYGPYLENQKLAPTEVNYAVRVRDGMGTTGAPEIAVLPDWVLRHYHDIGKSFQNTEHDIGG